MQNTSDERVRMNLQTVFGFQSTEEFLFRHIAGVVFLFTLNKDPHKGRTNCSQSGDRILYVYRL